MLVSGNDQFAQLVQHSEFIGSEEAMRIVLRLCKTAPVFQIELWKRRGDDRARSQFDHLSTSDAPRLLVSPSPRLCVSMSLVFIIRHHRFPLLNSPAR